MNEELYLVAYKDIEQKEIDEALWLKAMSHASGDKTKAKWAYIELRVDQLLRDPSLRHSASKKVRKPTHQSGAYMMWFSILFFFTIISAAVVVDVEEMTLAFFQWIVRFRRLVLDFCFTCIHFFWYIGNLLAYILALLDLHFWKCQAGYNQ